MEEPLDLSLRGVLKNNKWFSANLKVCNENDLIFSKPNDLKFTYESDLNISNGGDLRFSNENNLKNSDESNWKCSTKNDLNLSNGCDLKLSNTQKFNYNFKNDLTFSNADANPFKYYVGLNSVSSNSEIINIAKSQAEGDVCKNETKESSVKVGKNILTCEFCLKAFDRPSLLKRHRRTHTGKNSSSNLL